MKSLLEQIEALCALRGVSGDEGAVASYLAGELDPACQWQIDPLGNLLGFRPGRKRPKKRVMLAAHMDEVGFLVTGVQDDGLVRFAPVGGIDGRVIMGKPVLVGENAVLGVIGAKALHMQKSEERAKVPDPEQLFLDIGADSKEAAERLVRPGDRITFDSDFVRFGDGFIKGRALDDRAGCAILLDLVRDQPEYDVWFAFTVQEETGTTGAKAAAFTQKPDCSLVVEATTAADLPGVAEEKKVCRLGAGPVISYMDKGTIYDQGLYRLALNTARDLRIPAQVKEGVYGGNDSRAIQSAGNGARCAAVSMPCRYLHSPACVLKESDILHTRDLVRALAERMAALD